MMSQSLLQDFSFVNTGRDAGRVFLKIGESQLRVYVLLLAESEFGLTDNDMSKLMKIPSSTVCARRHQAIKKFPGMIFSDEVVSGPYGAKNNIYRLNDDFRDEIMREL